MQLLLGFARAEIQNRTGKRDFARADHFSAARAGYVSARADRIVVMVALSLDEGRPLDRVGDFEATLLGEPSMTGAERTDRNIYLYICFCPRCVLAETNT